MEVITHPGKSHRDEFLSCCCLLADKGLVDISRRAPLEEHLEDSNVFVVDVGGQLDTSKNNFDHHHQEDLPCSLHLLNEHFDWHLDTFPWYHFTNLLDTRGPQAAYGLAKTKPDPQLVSPVEAAVLRQFERVDCISRGSLLSVQMYEIGKIILEEAKRYHDFYLELMLDIAQARNTLLVRNAALAAHELFPRASKQIADNKKAATIISPAIDRETKEPTGGWTLYRVSDAPGVDFSCARDCDCEFTHNNGFLAVTKPCTLEKAIEIHNECVTGAIAII